MTSATLPTEPSRHGGWLAAFHGDERGNGGMVPQLLQIVLIALPIIAVVMIIMCGLGTQIVEGLKNIKLDQVATAVCEVFTRVCPSGWVSC
ncbi:MAG: hypothetical protein WB626_04680 [Bacteroidota bacterium]